MSATIRVVACVALFVVTAASTAAAQTFTGGVRGVVGDANGVIPGVTVTLTNEATNVSRETVSNDVGQYNFPAVPPGTYSIKSQLTGYKTFERSGLRVATQQFLTIDLTLELGTIQETVTVTGEAPLIDTTTASTGGVLDREALETLPAPGRNAFLIGITIPTVTPVGDPQFNRQQDQTNASRVSLGGGGIRANNYLLDGVPITELRGRAVLNPTIESLEEVKVQVHTYDSEMGRTGGGVFNLTAKSGTNAFRGSAFFQTRPVWGVSENFFVKAEGKTKEQSGLADTYYRLYGGGVGGPIWKNRTFFWTATEGYRSNTTRNERQVWPSLKQRAGDFSTSTVGGQRVRIFNPFCRGGVVNARCPATGTGSLATPEFTNAIIPRTHPAANPAGFALLGAWPAEHIGGPISSNENNEPNAEATGPIVDKADMFTIKGEHRFTDSWSMSGLYIYNKTDEPGSTIMKPEHWYIASQDNFFGPLRRRPHVFVLNNTNVINDSTVMTLRYGFSTWQDSCDPQPFSAGVGSLGFSSSYVNALAEKDIFPSLSFDEVADVGGWGGGPVRWNSPYTVNGTLSKLWGSHSLKAGADARRLSVELATESAMGGSFTFDPLFTSNNGVGGHELASVLLGVPRSGSVPFNRGVGEWFTTYYGAYIQDDWRVTGNLSVNFGVRFEHEDGLQETENRQTVGFDQDAVSPLDSRVPKTGLLAGRTIRGGLIFAGVDGAPTYQGDPAAVKVAPRGGFSYSLNTKTVVRGGYGLFYAPWNYAVTEHGSIGFKATTSMQQTGNTATGAPLVTLDNPFPAGLTQPIGSSLGLLTSTGNAINYVDQNKGNPKVHQYSVDIQRELPGNMAITVGYVGATGRDIGFQGTNNVSININQIDPDVARRVFPGPGGTWNPAALLAEVPNPFFGVAGAGGFASRPTIEAGQLLRPFPQFRDINQFERTDGGKRQYHAATFMLEKRTTGWLGGRYSYTFSRTEDNQFGESSTYQTRTGTPQNNYDLDAEYGVAHFDSPHRIILAPIVRFGRSSGNGAARWFASGWSASAIVELVSGSPLNAVLSSGASTSNLGLFGGRQRPNLVGDPNTSGSDNDRVATAQQPGARYFNATAFANPGAGTFGNAPRTIGDARYQFRKNFDISITKDTRFAGNQSGQIRFEILNLTNTPKFRGIDENAINLGSFGRIGQQAGFMRIWQISFRYAF